MAWSGQLILAAGSMLDQPDLALIEAAADAGFDGVGLRVSTGRTAGAIDAARRHAGDRGVVIHDTEVHRITTGQTDPQLLIEHTAALGASALLVVSDLSDHDATLKALADITTRCAVVGLRVGLEYMAWTDPSAPLDAIDVASKIGCELVVDVLHHARVGAGPDELDAIVESGRLGWVQICDAPLEPANGVGHQSLLHEARHGRMLPGTGQLRLDELISRLPAEIAVSVEVQSDVLLTIPAHERAQLLHDTARSVMAPHSPSSTG